MITGVNILLSSGSGDSVRQPRRVPGAGLLPVTVLAAVVLSGCVSEITHTRNGQTVTESVDKAPNSEDVDPCGLDESFLVELSVDPADLVRGRGTGSSPTCTWEKSAYSETGLYYWVEGETRADPANELRTLDNGRTVEVFYDSPGMARYILRTEDLTLNVSYSAPASLEPTAPEGVEAVMDRLLVMYGG